jgi:hypothetical protein
MKKLVYTISIVLIAWSTFAQDLTDALRYSNYHISGTARSTAMGNAFGALGGDFSSLSINPAGVAVYRSGEMTFTPSFGMSSVDGTFRGAKNNDSQYNLSINNLGYVTSIPTGQNSETGLVSFSFGLGFNRLKNFSMSSIAGAPNADHSLLTSFTDYMNANYNRIYQNEANELDAYNEKLAWDTYLVNHDNTNNEYYNDFKDAGYKQTQLKTLDRKGYINEYLLSLGANINHKVYFGATLGMHDVMFNENGSLTEDLPNGKLPYYNSFNYSNSLRTGGTGYNIKFGVIVKPIDALRLGIAFHSPTFYHFSDTYNSSLSASNGNSAQSPKGAYDYRIQTPAKGILSAAYVIGKSGLISADYEFVDYGTAKLRNGSDGYGFLNENTDIRNAYKPVGNLHLGGEYRVSQNVSLRAGYEYFPGVYKAQYLKSYNVTNNLSSSTIAGGIGFKEGKFFLDATYKYSMFNSYEPLYLGSINLVNYTANQNNLILTFGYKF